jgi:hypothetical protein
MFSLMTSNPTDNATSSPGSADGPAHSASPAGPMTDLFGQDLALASRLALPERARRPMTDATCGLRGFLSSPSAALQSSLANRLKRQLDTAGSTLFLLIWKDKATPAGRPYCQLAASARRTSDSDCGSWLTPVANDDNKSPEAHLAMKLRMGERDGTGSKRTAITSLQVMAKTAWPTPCSQDGPNGGPSQGIDRLPGAAAQAAWSTPRANKWGFPDAHGSQEAPWNTPMAADATGGHAAHKKADGTYASQSLGRQTIGAKSAGSIAETASAGQLSPEHSRWLMGYPLEWASCAPTAMRSCQRWPRNSSKPT